MQDQPEFKHKTVFLEPAVELLAPKPGQILVDATLGGGGHTKYLLTNFPEVEVIAIDWDMDAIEHAQRELKPLFGERLQLVFANFVSLGNVLHKMRIPRVDGILADFGSSQEQIFNTPGFSFSQDSALDMRMSSSHKQITAQQILAQADEKELEYIFSTYGEERFARPIAKKIVQERKIRPIVSTLQLATLVSGIVLSLQPSHKKLRIHPATKVFQALRIAVNHELQNIEEFLRCGYQALKEGGRLVCISFHSLEDRIVKNSFREFSQANPKSVILTKKPYEASPQDILTNPSCRSAKLRALKK